MLPFVLEKGYPIELRNAGRHIQLRSGKNDRIFVLGGGELKGIYFYSQRKSFVKAFRATSYLLEILEKIAKENRYKAFSAYVLQENAAMIHVFKKRYPKLKTSREGGDIEIHMDFDDAVES